MAMVANDPAAAKRVGIPQSVGAEYMKADKGRKFGSGSRADVQSINKPKTAHGKSAILARGGEVAESKKMVMKEIGFMKKAGAPRSMIKHEESEMKGMKKMAGGGITTAKMGTVKTAAPSRDGVATKGKTKGTMVKMAASKPLGMKRGGKC
jgi:DNA uptake protein ComE-like DNA-binding protein